MPASQLVKNPHSTQNPVSGSIALKTLCPGQCIMKERPIQKVDAVAPPLLRCAVQGFAPLRRRKG